jgi:hypothetical protein
MQRRIPTSARLAALATVVGVGAIGGAEPMPNGESVALPVGELREAQALGVKPSGQRESVFWVYNTFDCPDCFWQVNMSWADPACYVDGGANCNGMLWMLPLSIAPLYDGDDTYQAPIYNDGDNTWVTDIFFDDYLSDSSIWGDTGMLHPLSAFTGVAWMYNNYGSGVTKTYVFSYLWFDNTGGTYYGQWRWASETADGDNLLIFLHAGKIDEPLDPADTFEIPFEGWVCFDYDNETLEGHDDAGAWTVFLGGDLEDPDFPYPTELYEVGYNDEASWFSAGVDDPYVDPGWDGEPGLGYLDLINTGYLICWRFPSNAGELPAGHPTRMGIGYDGPPLCEGDVDGDNDTDQSDLGILLASFELPPGDPLFDPRADLDGDGEVGSTDLGILLADYECGW